MLKISNTGKKKSIGFAFQGARRPEVGNARSPRSADHHRVYRWAWGGSGGCRRRAARWPAAVIRAAAEPPNTCAMEGKGRGGSAGQGRGVYVGFDHRSGFFGPDLRLVSGFGALTVVSLAGGRGLLAPLARTVVMVSTSTVPPLTAGFKNHRNHSSKTEAWA
jgi:hypothetical protein